MTPEQLDAIEAWAAAGYRIVPIVDDATRQEVEALSDWLDDDSRQWEQLRKAQPATGGYDWMLRLAAAERRAAELLAAAYLRRTTMPEPAHQIVLARIDWGSAYWDLECLHPSTDERFHVYRSGEVLGYHDECILRPWWNECGIELLEDTEGPIVTPIPVRAAPTGDGWVLAQTEAAGDN